MTKNKKKFASWKWCKVIMDPHGEGGPIAAMSVSTAATLLWGEAQRRLVLALGETFQHLSSIRNKQLNNSHMSTA